MKLDKYWLLFIITFLVSILIGISSYFITYQFFKDQILENSKKNALNYVEVASVSVGSKSKSQQLIEILEKAPYIQKVFLNHPKGNNCFLIRKNLMFPDGNLRVYVLLNKNLILNRSREAAQKVALSVFFVTLLLTSLILIAVRKFYLKPLWKIRKDIRKISKGEFSKLPETRTGDEFSRIRKSINQMIDTIRKKEEKEDVISQFIHLLTVGKGFNGEFASLMRAVLNMTGCDGVIIGIKDSDENIQLRYIPKEENSETIVQTKPYSQLQGIEPYLLELQREIETTKTTILSSTEREIGIKYLIGIPLVVMSDTVGFIIFFRRNEEPISKDAKRFIRNIAKSIAISVEIKKLINDLERKLKQEKELTEKIVKSLVRGIEIRDSYTRGHSERVAFFSKRIAQTMGLSSKEVEAIYIAGLLHDIGKIGIPDSILLKPGRLSKEEYEIIKLHPILSYELLKHVDVLKNSLPGIKYHHERWDGTGYPEGLKGKKIPLQARILAVADSFDAMTSDRIYRKGISKLEALKELKKLAGKHYDPEIVENALHVLLNEEPPKTMDDYISADIFSTIEERRLDYYLRDHLTGVFNRNALELAYKIARDRFGQFTAFTIDIKELREINVREGWEKGDRILKRTVEILLSNLRNSVIVRYSGDNFLIFYPEIKDVEEAVKKIEEELGIKVTLHKIRRFNNIEELKIEMTRLEFES